MPFTKIYGTGSYVPDTVRNNSDLEKMLGTDPEKGTTDKWIMERVGIKERRIANQYETHLYMAVRAIRQAIWNAIDNIGNTNTIKLKETSIILTGNTHIPGLIPCEASKYAVAPDTCAFDVVTEDLKTVGLACKNLFDAYTIIGKGGTEIVNERKPDWKTQAIVYQHKQDGLAQVMAKEMGMNAEQSFDLATGCASFNYGLALADALIKKEPQYIVVAAVDKMLDVTNPKDRSTVVLFGELAGAALLGPSETPGFIAHSLHTDGTQRDAIVMKQAEGWDKPYFWQDGPAVYKWAVRTMREQARLVVEKSNGRVVLVPHQANPRMLKEAFKDKLFNRVADSIVTGDLYGNSSTASIAHALDVGFRAKRIRLEDYVGILGFGAGLSDGVNVYRNP